MEHDMDLARQCRKAEAAALAAKQNGEHEKADFINHLAFRMLCDAQDGRPHPWSFYAPQVDEEFDAGICAHHGTEKWERKSPCDLCGYMKAEVEE